jgi:hypothetical protein
LTPDGATRREPRLESLHYRDAQNDDDGMDYMAVHEWLHLEVDAQEKSLTVDAATRRGLRLESHHHRDAQDDDDGMDYMAETHMVPELESHHYCDAQDDNDWIDHMAVHDSNQLVGDANEKEKLSVGVVVIRSDLGTHHEMNMDVRKWPQLEEDAQEENMTESDEDDWDNNLGADLDVDLDIDLDSNLVVELGNALEESGPLQTDQHL